MSEQSLKLLERIRARLQSTARRITMADILLGAVITLGVASALWGISIAVEAGFWLDTTPRTALFWGIAASTVALVGYFIIRPLLQLTGVLPGPTPDSIAHRIGERFPEIGDRLVNLLDLSEGRRTDAPDELVDGAVQMLGREVDPVSFEAVEDFSSARRAVGPALIPLLSLLLFVAAAPSTFLDASKRILSPGEHFDRPAPFRLSIEPGSAEVARGSSLDIVVRADGSQLPRIVDLEINNAGEDHVETVRLSTDSSGSFRYPIANVRRSFRYRAAAAPVRSQWHEITVTEHPLVRGLQVTLDFPAYSGVPPQRLDPNVGDVAGLRGTRVQVDVSLGGADAASAHVAFDDGSTAPLEVDGDRASGAFTLTREGSYQILLENEGGLHNRDPISYGMRIVDDASPSVVIVRPESDAVLNEDLRRIIESRISDDFGFHDLTLFYRLAESRFGETSETFSSIGLSISDPRQLDQDVIYGWDVPASTELDPVPGDVIEYYVRVRDNDAFAGFKTASTPVQRLRLPSLAEQYEQLSRTQDDAESKLEDMLDEAQQLDRQFSELRDEIRRKQDGDWEDQRQIEQIEERQQRLEEQVNDLSQQIDEMNQSAQENNLLSEETLQKYQEMQKVVEEINSPELREALQQLQESIQNLDLSQMQKAIENFEFNEQQYQQRLERALEVFKNLRAQQSLEEAARRAEELSKQQEKLAEETERLSEEGERRPEGDEAEERRPVDDPNRDETPPSQRPGSEDEEREGNPSEEDTGREISPDETPRGEDHSDEGQPEDPASEEDRDRQSPSDDMENRQPPSSEDPAGQMSREEQLARQQELSKEEMEALEELLQEAQRQLDELKKGPADEMRKLNESVQQQQMPQQMQENARQLRQNRLQDAQSGQQQMQQQLQQLQSQLSQMQSNMQGSQMQVNLAGLRRALADVLTLSQDQESLRQRLNANVSEAPSMREDARRQVELSEGLSTVIDSLQKLGKNIPQMSRAVQRLSGQALREMGQATEAMTDRSVGEAAGYQTAAMMNLNELALLLSDVMNQLMNQSGSGSGSGNMQQMIQQMQQMAQQQQQLNQQIQQFLNDMQGNRLNVDMQERLQQMGAQQRAIKKQLDELRRNPEARGQLLGDLDKIAEQMEETIQELRQRQVEPRTVERQQQILQRLLDAQRSINERGRKEERKAREGEDFQRESPADLPPEEAAEKLRRDLIRALESGYAPDYEELIKRYFELLQREHTTEQE